MKTKYIEKRTKAGLAEPRPDPLPDPLSDFLDLPRPIIALARDFPDGHLIQAHSHHRAQLLYASSGVMTVTTAQGIWVVPPLRAVWVPAETEHQVLCSGSLSMRSLYLDPSAVPGLPGQCLVLSVSPLLRELILEAVRLPPLYELGGPDRVVLRLPLDRRPGRGQRGRLSGRRSCSTSSLIWVSQSKPADGFDC